MATLTLIVTEEMLASIEAMAKEGMLPVEVQAAVLLGDGIKRRRDRVKANARQRKHDVSKRQPDVSMTSPDVRVPALEFPPAPPSNPSPDLIPPLYPPTDPVEVPFTEFPPGSPEDDEEIGEAPKAPSQKKRHRGPDLLRRATPAPKGGRRVQVGTDDPRWMTFVNEYIGPRCKGWAEALTVWVKEDLSSDDLFPLVMAALAEDKASADWQREEGRFIPAPAPWLRDKRWLDLGLMSGGKVVALRPEVDEDQQLFAKMTAGKTGWTDAKLVNFWLGKAGQEGISVDGAAARSILEAQGIKAALLPIGRAFQANRKGAARA